MKDSVRVGGSFSSGSGIANSQLAVALGELTMASGSIGATAMGVQTTASGRFGATATGNNTTASGGYGATAMGHYTTASGDGSMAVNGNTTAKSHSSFAAGRYNSDNGDSAAWVATDPLFMVGNGANSGSPNNALVVYKNGNATIDGAVTADTIKASVPQSYIQNLTDTLEAYQFDPSREYNFYEDFDVGTSVNRLIGRYTWAMAGAGAGYSCVVDTSTTQAYGVIRLTGGTGVGNSYVYITSTGDNSTWMGAAPFNASFTLKMRVKMYDPTTKGKNVWFGVASTTPNAPANGLYFYADSANYHCISTTGTALDSITNVGQTGNWTNFKIVSNGSSVAYSINDTLVATLATTSYAAGMKYFATVKSLEAVTSKRLAIDYFFCKVKGLSR